MQLDDSGPAISMDAFQAYERIDLFSITPITGN